jgi:glycosyltransferase involved in cell wall biosynthesis
MSWITIQLGSREHYAIPSALWRARRLDRLVTDSWLSRWQSSAVGPFLPSLAARRNDGLPDRLVASRTLGRLAIDCEMRLRKYDAWQAILHRNAWFQDWCAAEVMQSKASTVFSYCYTARKPFEVASGKSVRCVLGQIDPGPREAEVVLEATTNYRCLAPTADRAPQKYWDLWRDEIAMADKIIVNSPWSARLLVEAGVPSEKLVEIPLVYEPSGSMEHALRLGEPTGRRGARSVERGTGKRLKALFLGSVILRKGVGQLFDAIRILRNEPVDFTFAGPVGVKIPDEISSMPKVRFLGPVDKATAEKLYGESDVFLFPTLSDGFGLTQLEALAQGLPVITSTHCGQVVDDRVSGLVLPDVTPEVIAGSIMQLVRDRDLLDRLKANSRVPDKCHPRHLAPALLALEKD